MKKLSKTNKLILAVSLLILIATITISTYAIYKSSATGTSELKTAAWKIKLNNNSITSSNTFNFDLTEAEWTHETNINSSSTSQVIAPGSIGTYGLKIDTTGTEVDVSYEIIIRVLQNNTQVDLSTINPNLTIGIYDGDTNKGTSATGSIKAGNTKELAVKIIWNYVDEETSNNQDVKIEDNNYTIEVTVVTKQRTALQPVYPTGKTKDTVETGDVVTIGTEEFYVVRHDGNDLVLLAHYNLKVGKIYYNTALRGEYTSDDPGYGLQSSEVRGSIADVNEYSNGTVKFSSTNYWNEKVGEGLEYPGNYCYSSTSFSNCAYIYDSNSILYPFVELYKTLLEDMGATIKDARLMTLEESIMLKDNNYNAWRETSYWIGTAYSSDVVWNVLYSGAINTNDYSHGINRGVRPVIVI